MDIPKPRPFYIKFEQDHNGQRWTIQKPPDQRDISSGGGAYGSSVTLTTPVTQHITGSREQMQWLVSELSTMLDGSPQ